MRSLWASTLTLVILAGCSSHSPPKSDETKVKQFAGHGYVTADHYGTATTFATWEEGKCSVDITLTVPTKSGPFPLVIYLPALGETNPAGRVWRTAWGQAGYAVMSVQPLAEDGHAWSSARARTGDFSVLARERYSGKAMTERIEALQFALAELIRRHDQKEAPLDRIDLSRAAVAGYDLGAYTAIVIVGESVRDTVRPALPISIGAAIALSPYAVFSGVSFGGRYGDVRGPVLSITGDNDADPLGLVTTPALRTAPFQYMPGGDKYLLMLSDISHRTFAGGNIKQEADENAPPERASSGSRRHKATGNAGGSNTGGAGEKEQSASPGGTAPSPTSQAMGVTVIQSVTTAFLDAYLKNESIAREWLEKDTLRWIKDRGEFKTK